MTLVAPEYPSEPESTSSPEPAIVNPSVPERLALIVADAPVPKGLMVIVGVAPAKVRTFAAEPLLSRTQLPGVVELAVLPKIKFPIV